MKQGPGKLDGRLIGDQKHRFHRTVLLDKPEVTRTITLKCCLKIENFEHNDDTEKKMRFEDMKELKFHSFMRNRLARRTESKKYWLEWNGQIEHKRVKSIERKTQNDRKDSFMVAPVERQNDWWTISLI